MPPPPKASGSPEPGLEPGAERLPDGPILYYVETGAGTARITPVAEISGDTLIALRASANDRSYTEAFIAGNLRQGSEFVLFSGGVRAGTFITQSASVDDAGCRPVPRATGTLELSESGSSATSFLAVARLQAPQIARRNVPALEPTRTMRVLAPIYADRMLRNRRFPLPGNWDRAMARLQPFPVPNAQDPAFTATFLVGDTLGPGLDDAGHSLFFVAVPGQLGYDTVYVSLRDYAADGKAAPEMVDFLDWNRDDSPDLLLRVFGTNDVWYEAVGRDSEGRWRTIFRDRCERPEAVTAPPDTIPTPAPTPATGVTPPDTGGVIGSGQPGPGSRF